MNSQPYQGKEAERFKLELLRRRWLSDISFEIELTRPPSFAFKPGQRILVSYQHYERDYSLVSAPTDANLTLCIRSVQEGLLTPLLATIKIGSDISFTGPYGYFTFRPSQRHPVFIATGTGVAPFVSMARSGTKQFTLLHGVRSASELYYESILRTAAKKYIPCLSGISDEISEQKDGFRGRVTGYLEKGLPPGLYDFYLCGRVEMVRDVIHLVDERFPGSRVYTEIFY